MNDDKPLIKNVAENPPAGKPDEYWQKDPLSRRLREDYIYDITSHDQYVLEFDAYEAMLISQTYDAVSRETRQGITDGMTMTLAQEATWRVVGQLPTGVVRAAGKKDAGAGMLLDIIRQQYIYPNANAQHPFLEKIQMWDFYSRVYGYMPLFVDWHVSQSGYIGPDCWVWSPRNFIPQNGRISVNEMDYCHAISYVTSEYLEGILEAAGEEVPDEDEETASGGQSDDTTVDTEESDGWDLDAVEELLNYCRHNSLWNDNTRDSFVKRKRQYQAIHGQIALVTRFEAGEDGEWVTFSPSWGYRCLRRLKNPHKTGRIPFFIKYDTPLFDNFYGLGAFQRAKPLQFAKDGLTNFYFEGIKMNIYQPTVINANGVVMHTIDQSPGAVWQETIPNSVRRLETSTAGLSTYQAASNQLNASLQNQFGTTQTMLNAESAMDPQFGKTPQALQLLAGKENTRDNADRSRLEGVLQDVITYMLQLVGNVGTEDIPINVWAEEVKEIIAAGYTDVLDMIDVNSSGESGKLRIKPESFKDLDVKFHIDSHTTALEDKADKLKAVQDWLGSVTKLQNELQTLRNQGKQVDWALVFAMLGEFGGVPNFGKVIIPITPEEQAAEAQQMQTETHAQTQPAQPRIDMRLIGDMDPGEVSSVMQSQGLPGSSGTGAPMPGQSGAPVNSAGSQPPGAQLRATQYPGAAAPTAPAPALAPPAMAPAAPTFRDPEINAMMERIRQAAGSGRAGR